MAEAWESLPDVVPAKESWEDLPDVAPSGPPQSRGSFFDYLKAKFGGEAEATPDVASLSGVKTIQTPTGPTHVDAQGRAVLTPEESDKMQAGGFARFKQRLLEGGLSTLSGGGTLMDEMRGTMKSMSGDTVGKYLADRLSDTPAQIAAPSPAETYQGVRDSTRRDVASATRNASPTVSVGDMEMPVLPMVGAALPSMLAPLPAGAFARILGGGTTAAIDQTGRSEVDISRGDNLGEFATDIVKSGGLGLGVSGLAEGASVPLRAAGNAAIRKIGDVANKQAQRDVAQVGKEVAHLGGVARAETQKGSRLTENTLRRANGLTVDPSDVTDPTQLRAIAMLDDPQFKALADSVANNTMDDVPAQIRRMADAKEAARSAAASASQDASDRTRDYFKQSTWGTQIQPRLTTLAENAALGGAAGAATGGAAGAFRGGIGDMVDGIISGLGGSALSGGSGLKTLAKNAIGSPLVQVSALSSVANGALGGASKLATGARMTPAMTAAATQSNAFDALAKRFGINAKSKEELANEAFVRGQTP